MTAGQAVLHLSGAFQMALQQGPFVAHVPNARPSPLNSRLGRHLVFGTPFHWPRNTPTVPELEVGRQPSPAVEEFPEHIADLLLLIRHFSQAPATVILPKHPLLGALSRDQWMRWGYLHTDHHLRQFRC